MAIFGRKFRGGAGPNTSFGGISYSPSQGLDFGNPIPQYIRSQMGGGQNLFNGQISNPSSVQKEGTGSVAGYVGAYNNAGRFNPSITPVRQKFEGYVNFNFNAAVGITSLNNNDTRNSLSSLCRTAEVPTAEIQTDVKNQYNRKRITVTHTEFKPITVTAYDTIDSAWVIVLMKMYAHLFTQPIGKFDTSGDTPLPKSVPNDVVPEAIAGGGSEAVTKGNFDSNFAGYNLRPAVERNFITSMDIVKFHGQKAIRYTLFNPFITTFDVEGIDHADSSPAMITMNIQYENFSINPKVNDWLSEDELKRFSGFNVGEWDRLRNGNHLEPSMMVHPDLPGQSIVDNPVMGQKNLEFLNLEKTRSKQQNAFFKSFNNESEDEKKADNSDRKAADKSVDTQRQQQGGTIPSNTSGASGGGTI